MAVAIIIYGDTGPGPAISRRLNAEGYDVSSVASASVDRSTIADLVVGLAADGLNLLVNNAPPFEYANALDLSATEFASALGSGLHTVFSTCREAARSAQAHGASLTIVNVVSVLGIVGLPGRIAEACVSAGVLATTEALAAEWGPLGIRVVAVSVGPTTSWVSEEAPLDDYPGVIPLRRTVDYEDVASAVAVLAGSDTAAVTGQGLVVDAGWLAYGWRKE